VDGRLLAVGESDDADQLNSKYLINAMEKNCNKSHTVAAMLESLKSALVFQQFFYNANIATKSKVC
jgi:hypothetical protein